MHHDTEPHPTSLVPIRKIAAAAIAGAVFYVARLIGLDLGESEVNEAALALSIILAGYVTPSK